jgi:hypothetical protein
MESRLKEAKKFFSKSTENLSNLRKENSLKTGEIEKNEESLYDIISQLFLL